SLVWGGLGDNGGWMSTQRRRALAHAYFHCGGYLLRRFLAGPSDAFLFTFPEDRDRGPRFDGSMAFHDALRRHHQSGRCWDCRTRPDDAGTTGQESRCREYREPNFSEYAFF